MAKQKQRAQTDSKGQGGENACRDLHLQRRVINYVECNDGMFNYYFFSLTEHKDYVYWENYRNDRINVVVVVVALMRPGNNIVQGRGEEARSCIDPPDGCGTVDCDEEGIAFQGARPGDGDI